MRTRTLGIAALVAGCSSGSASGTRDAGHDASQHDAQRDAKVADATTDAPPGLEAQAEAAPDVAVPTHALVRLANWSPDAPGIDLCVAPHASRLWTGPILRGALGTGILGTLTVVHTGSPGDSGTDARVAHDTGVDAHDARADAGGDARETGTDAAADTGKVDTGGPADDDASGPGAGVTFPRASAYVSMSPGRYDVRVIAGGSVDCSVPLFDDRTDLPAFVAGADTTLATVGDLNDQGTDPAIALVAFSDDSSVPSGQARVRFVNSVPSVTETSLVRGGVLFSPIISAAQFGEVGADTDGGLLDSDGYLTLAPVSDATWFVINANGKTVLAGVFGVGVPSGALATVVAIGGESGATETAIGVLVCIDRPPIVAGETASCALLEGPGSAPVCPACP